MKYTNCSRFYHFQNEEQFENALYDRGMSGIR